MKTFDEIYILDLHGNSKRKETAPDGSKDENVFDIQQGVAIGIFTKYPASKLVKTKTIRHMDLYGLRSKKYEQLFDLDINKTPWKILTPQAPFFLFRPQNIELLPEYETGWKINDIFPVNSTGIKTHRDHFALDFDREVLRQRIMEFRDLSISDEVVRQKYKLPDTRDWKLHNRRIALNNDSNFYSCFEDCLYRPFDFRSIFYSEDVIELPRPEVMVNMLGKNNLGLVTTRQQSQELREWSLVYCSNSLIETCSISNKTREANYLFPLHIHPKKDKRKTRQVNLFTVEGEESDSIPNFAPTFLVVITTNLGLRFIPEGCGDLRTTFGPEDIFHYIYAIFHSPTYRSRYAGFLKMDFPRVPLTSSLPLFRALCALGKELVAFHLLEAPKVSQFITSYPISGDNRVEKGCPRYVEGQGRVFINPAQYFEGVPPQVWQFHIGGYQVLEKWLKDRRGRQLTYADLTHYQKVVVALAETIRLMAEVDKAIPEWPIS
jgi:predicted helicase